MSKEIYERYSDAWYISEYLKYGSVEESLRVNHFDMCISPASFHRLVKQYGIVKSMGRREVSLTEALHFFAQKALEPTMGIQTLYFQMPHSFQTSVASLHRIYNRIITNAPHRFATALILHSEESDKVLFGHEVGTDLRQAKFKGDLSLPMTFCGQNESNINAVTRVLQQEVFTAQTIKRLMPLTLPSDISPFLMFRILDVEVRVFDIVAPYELLQQANSYKLVDHQILQLNELYNYPQVRHGITEIVEAWEYGNVAYLQSNLNQQLLAI